MSNLKNKIMEKIEGGEIKMRSKSFFSILWAILEIVVFAIFILVIYLVNLSFYIPQKALEGVPGIGPRHVMLAIPWHLIFIIVTLLAIMFWVIYRHTDFYKRNWPLFIFSILLFILALGFTLTKTSFNKPFENQPNLKPLYRRHHFDRPGMMIPVDGATMPVVPGSDPSMRFSDEIRIPGRLHCHPWCAARDLPALVILNLFHNV